LIGERVAVVVGGGILGNTIAYWLSHLRGTKVFVMEKERDTSIHTTSRNTGMVHRPFYMNPQKKKILATSASISYYLWKEFASSHNLPWNEVGTLEVAKTEEQVKTIEKYEKWALINGVQENQISILNREQIREIERNVSAPGGILSKTDTSTDYGILSNKIAEINKINGVRYLFNSRVMDIRSEKRTLQYFIDDSTTKRQMTCDLLINAAGNRSLDLAHRDGTALDKSVMYFRGEYWKVDENLKGFVSRNIYSVADNPEFPFLDPHLIVRPNGTLEIGPNAVPVSGPEFYREGMGKNKEFFPILKRPLSPKINLLLNPQFIKLAMGEWKSSLSQREMIGRVNSFIPNMDFRKAKVRGFSGIRGSLVDKHGFVPETIVQNKENCLHVLNYNSPGATGSPYFSYLLYNSILKNGLLEENKGQDHISHEIWKDVDSYNTKSELLLF
jgi:L-2-hydroxyglutarate oxidase